MDIVLARPRRRACCQSLVFSVKKAVSRENRCREENRGGEGGGETVGRGGGGGGGGVRGRFIP